MKLQISKDKQKKNKKLTLRCYNSVSASNQKSKDKARFFIYLLSIQPGTADRHCTG